MQEFLAQETAAEVQDTAVVSETSQEIEKEEEAVTEKQLKAVAGKKGRLFTHCISIV